MSSKQEKRPNPGKPAGAKDNPSRRRRRKKGMCLEDRPIQEKNAAGIDIGAREIYVAVPPDRDEHPVRTYPTFTEGLEAMAVWLVSCGVTTVAMESTGVYWIPVYDVLEEYGLTVCLVNARHMRNVPGKRTDWHECQWLQYLHSVGLLRSSFRPEAGVCALRTLYRHRDELVQAATQHTQHMHKALTQMNLQIHHVISDLTGTTGLAIVDAILAGERDAAKLAALRDHRIKASEDVMRQSLVGNWLAEHLFTLKQAREADGSACNRWWLANRRSRSSCVNSRPGSILPRSRCRRTASGTGARKRGGRRRVIRIGIRSPDRGLQTVRGGRDADPGGGGDCPDPVQRAGPRSVEVADGGALCLLAGLVSG